MLKRIGRGWIFVVLVLAALAGTPAHAWDVDRTEGGGFLEMFMEFAAELWSGLTGEASDVDTAVIYAADDGGATTQSSGCIDPDGRPRPCPKP